MAITVTYTSSAPPRHPAHTMATSKQKSAVSKPRRLGLVQSTRALKACDECRKGKTRCLKPSAVAVCCLRCLAGNIQCSLEIEYRQRNPGAQLVRGVPVHLVAEEANDAPINTDLPPADVHIHRKLDLIYSLVLEILGAVRSRDHVLPGDVKLLLDAASSMKSPVLGDSRGPNSRTRSLALTPVPGAEVLAAMGRAIPAESDPLAFVSHAPSFSMSPFSVVARLVSGVPRPIGNLLGLSTLPDHKSYYEMADDVISEGILSETDAIDLMNDFRANYGRWVLFPLHVGTDELVANIRKRLSLLLTTCCCLLLRYTLNTRPNPGDIDSHRRKRNTFRRIMEHLVRDLDRLVMRHASFAGTRSNSGDVEFLQAMVILLIYLLLLLLIVESTVDRESLLEDESSVRDLSLDPWLLSGIGLSTFVLKAMSGGLGIGASPGSPLSYSMFFGITSDGGQPDIPQTLTCLRIYNHLILVHLVSCVFSGRMCMVDEIRLNQCMALLELPTATNFDGRMVSEIGILLIAYNFVQVNLNVLARDLENLDATLAAAVDEITVWYDQWEYLFTQPTLQFVEFCYDFCYLLIYYTYVHAKYRVVSGPGMGDVSLVQSWDSLLGCAPKQAILEMVAHALHLVDFVNKVENDSYFAYLLDQIHFCFFFGALTLINTLYFLKKNDKLYYLDEVESAVISEATWRSALESVDVLVGKLERVAQGNPDDILTTYMEGIKESKLRSFPLHRES